jgi:hypothetical protein
MALSDRLARLEGGPMDGCLVQAPLDEWRRPASVTGLPVPVLDEQTEMFWWDTANYISAPLPDRWHPGDPWPYGSVRTPPGYPTLSKDLPESRWVESPD